MADNGCTGKLFNIIQIKVCKLEYIFNSTAYLYGFWRQGNSEATGSNQITLLSVSIPLDYDTAVKSVHRSVICKE